MRVFEFILPLVVCYIFVLCAYSSLNLFEKSAIFVLLI